MRYDNRQRAVRRELGEPEEMRNPVPWPVAVISAALILWGAWYYFQNTGYPLLAGDRRTATPVLAATDVLDGAPLYAAHCAACHQGNGAGLAGVFPPLAGADWVTGDPTRLTQILLYGLQGPIEVQGMTYNGVMPAFAYLEDAELAAVLSYIRESWGNAATPLTPALIADERSRFPERIAPWQGGAELDEAFPPASP